MNIEIADTFDKFLALEPSWNELLKKSSADNPFSTFEWCRAWLETLSKDIELLIIVIRDETTIKGIAPFCIRKNRIIAFIGYPQNDYAGLILGESIPESLDLIAKYLSGIKSKWNKIILDQFADGNPQIEMLGKAVGQYSLHYRIEPSDTCPVMIITDREAARKLYHKRDITKKINWFKKEGDFQYNIYTDMDTTLQRLDDLFTQHIYRWKGTSTPSYFVNDSMKQFYKKFMLYMNPKGWVQFSSLTLDDKFLALYISFEYNNALYLYKTSYNPDFSKKSPGHVILRYLFDYALERNLMALDFARGDEGYKDRFANAVKKSRRLIIYKSGMAKFLADSFFSFRYSKAVDIIYRNKFALRIREKLF